MGGHGGRNRGELPAWEGRYGKLSLMLDGGCRRCNSDSGRTCAPPRRRGGICGRRTKPIGPYIQGGEVGGRPPSHRLAGTTKGEAAGSIAPYHPPGGEYGTVD